MLPDFFLPCCNGNNYKHENGMAVAYLEKL